MKKRYDHMCPYCGGMHMPGECPMFMMPSMPFGGYMPPMGGMMPCPMPGMEMPGMDMMQMMQTMQQHTQMLQHIQHRVDEMYTMCKEIYLKMAKG